MCVRERVRDRAEIHEAGVSREGGGGGHRAIHTDHSHQHPRHTHTHSLTTEPPPTRTSPHTHHPRLRLIIIVMVLLLAELPERVPALAVHLGRECSGLLVPALPTLLRPEPRAGAVQHHRGDRFGVREPVQRVAECCGGGGGGGGVWGWWWW